jgi:integrase
VFITPRGDVMQPQLPQSGVRAGCRIHREARADAARLARTAASLAVQAGANVKAVQRMLGCASAAMTLDVYARLFNDDLDAVADRLDAAQPRLVRTICGLRPSSDDVLPFEIGGKTAS